MAVVLAILWTIWLEWNAGFLKEHLFHVIYYEIKQLCSHPYGLRQLDIKNLPNWGAKTELG